MGQSSMAKMGRPKQEVPMQVVDAACQLNATARQVIEILASQGYHVSHSTLVREIQRVHGKTFEEYRDQKTDLTRLKLVQKAVNMANEGNATMLIFCLKSMCGWSEIQ
jgi:transposase-like protein